MALCFTDLILVAGTAFFAALAGAAAGVAVVAADVVADTAAGLATGVPVWANTGRVSADSSAAAMREVDFMAIFLKEKFFCLGA